MWPLSLLGGHGLPQGVACGLRGSQVDLGVTNGLVGLQIALEVLLASWGHGWPWGVTDGLLGLQLTSGVAGDTNFMSSFYKCPKLLTQR
jgi:hypothetical protein